MLKMIRTTLSLLLFFSFSYSHAVEIYSVLTNKCDLARGLIIDINEEHLAFIDLDGTYKVIPRDSIEFLVIHNTLENPFLGLNLNEGTKAQLLNIYVNNSDEILFTGWAVKFIEDLVIFYDIKGNSHVLELKRITKIRPSDIKKSGPIKIKGEKAELRMGNIFFKCAQLEDSLNQSKKAILPTRTLGDKVQISEFLSNFEVGFQKLRSYQERTYLYARPFLYERKTKLGFTSYNDYFQNPKSVFPFYYQWSTGEAYRFQSFNQLGNVPNEYVPSPEPFFLARSDVKTHVFHATFVGNLSSLPAGTDFYTEQIETIDKELLRPKNKILTAPSLNYLALMGGDYGPWSLSFGTYYPTYMVRYYNKEQNIDEFREILASKVSPMFRIMYTTKNLKLRGVYSKTSYSEASQPNDKQISRDTDVSVIGFLRAFDFESQFIRAGAEYQLTDRIQVGLDQIILTSEYNEATVSGYLNQFGFDHFVTTGFIRHWFGEKVTLRLYVNYFQIEEKADVNDFKDSESLSDFGLGGAFEFVF
ncbi:MAG: hypothetical protein KDD40_03235 [Bdellovibrionales bacterium]|nr:hypothetical protein [Bdellovibrionales bacterium]